MKRWVVKIEENELKQLSPEHLKIGTLVNSNNGEQYLVFRDNSSAKKLASQISGGKVESGMSFVN